MLKSSRIHLRPAQQRPVRVRSILGILPVAFVALAACHDASLATAPADVAPLTSKGTTRVRIDTVMVSPNAASVQAGATVQLSATAYASGQPVAATIAWASANSAIATVSSTGLVTGVTAGSTTVSASAGSKRTTVPVRVTASAPAGGGLGGGSTGSPASAECSAPKAGWIFCDDFEADRTASYFETDNAQGSFTRSASVGVNGSMGMRAHFAAGQVNAGSLHLAFGRTPSSYIRPVDAGTTNYREIYWRVYLRDQAGWQGGGGDKLSRAQSLASPNWAQAMAAQVWSGGQASNWNYLMIDPASGTDSAGTLRTTTYNDFANLRWLGAARSQTPIFDSSHVGQWYCVEAHARLNDAGQSNGTFDLWINGNPEAARSGLNWVGSFSAYGINAVYLENYWNNGSPVAQARDMDNFVVSTSRIGC